MREVRENVVRGSEPVEVGKIREKKLGDKVAAVRGNEGSGST